MLKLLKNPDPTPYLKLAPKVPTMSLDFYSL